MPYHYSNKKNASPENMDKAATKLQEMKRKKLTRKIPNKPVATKKNGKKLTDEQEAKLRKHKFAHSAKHIALMRKLMLEGMSFTASHKKAQKEVGK